MTDSPKDKANPTNDADHPKSGSRLEEHKRSVEEARSLHPSTQRAVDKEHKPGENVTTASAEQRANEPAFAGNTANDRNVADDEDGKGSPKEENVPEQVDNRRAMSTLSVSSDDFDIPELEGLVDRMQGSGDAFFFGKDVRSREGAQLATLELLEWAVRVGIKLTVLKKTAAEESDEKAKADSKNDKTDNDNKKEPVAA